MDPIVRGKTGRLKSDETSILRLSADPSYLGPDSLGFVTPATAQHGPRPPDESIKKHRNADQIDTDLRTDVEIFSTFSTRELEKKEGIKFWEKSDSQIMTLMGALQ